GTYFYVTEWDLNRYDINGVKDGTVSFDEDVFGSAWDGQYLWMLNDNKQIKCWDIALWPNLIEVTANNFSPPSDSCRGLWFDGTYFWSTQGFDGSLGYIYQFDYSGQVIDQILAPAWVGFGVCKLDLPVSIDEPPQQEVPPLSVFPNPCTDRINITFTLQENAFVECTLYNIKGNKLKTFCPGNLCSGTHQFEWDVHEIPPGIYLIKVDDQENSEPIKILHLSS
ncbi:MAG: T9SS C-terminal target domain-containing protein, partial [Planctomycetaceae bacterium]